MELHYQESGDKGGNLFVFIHGGGVSGWMWEQQLLYFADYHCVTVDLPGHGRSLGLQNFGILSTANSILTIIESLRGDKKVIVCGFSIGAQIALQLLSLTAIDYAIINSALVRPQRLLNFMIKPFLPMSYPLAKIKGFSKAQAKALLIPETYSDIYYAESSKISYKILRDTMHENMTFTLPQDIENCSAKTLITVGAKEQSMMRRSAHDLVSVMNCAIGVTIPNLGHGLPYARPNLFNELVKTWLQTGDIIDQVKVISN